MMSSAAHLDQYFGSESEDDNFNPVPAEDSDNDAAGDSEDGRNTGVNGNQKRRRSPAQPVSDEESEDDEDVRQGSPVGRVNGEQTNGSGSLGPKSEDEEDTKKIGNGGLDGAIDEEDEEDEDEDEDDEEAISV